MYSYRAACFLVVISAGLVGLGAAAGTRGEIPLKPGDYVFGRYRMRRRAIRGHGELGRNRLWGRA